MIDQFKDEYRWLSNFWYQPDWMTTNFPIFAFEVRVPTVEHGYQAAKAELVHERNMILAASTPGKAKRLGQKIQIREDWDRVKNLVMCALLQRKFTHPEMAQLLLATKDELLVEGNTWGDTYWGAVPLSSQPGYVGPWWPINGPRSEAKWIGKNMLGILLDNVRHSLQTYGDTAVSSLVRTEAALRSLRGL